MRCLEWKITHEHGLGLNFTSLIVSEFRIHIQRSRIGVILFLALLHGVTWIFEVWIGEGQRHGLSEVLNRRNFVKDLVKTGDVRNSKCTVVFIFSNTCLPAFVTNQPVKAVGLYAEKIRHFNWLTDRAEINTVSCLTQFNVILICACNYCRCTIAFLSSQGEFLTIRCNYIVFELLSKAIARAAIYTCITAFSPCPQYDTSQNISSIFIHRRKVKFKLFIFVVFSRRVEIVHVV